jgi:hypothetical protein
MSTVGQPNIRPEGKLKRAGAEFLLDGERLAVNPLASHAAGQYSSSPVYSSSSSSSSGEYLKQTTGANLHHAQLTAALIVPDT